jgi:hypothetical protein
MFRDKTSWTESLTFVYSYEVRPKSGKTIDDDIASLIKKDFSNLSGIVYCMSRRACEDVSTKLQVSCRMFPGNIACLNGIYIISIEVYVHPSIMLD